MPSENIGRIISINKKDDKIKIVFSSSWKSIVLSNDNFTNDFYYVGKEITKKEYDKICESIGDEKYLKYALNLCNKKAYTKYEIVTKLKQKGAEIKTIDRVLKKLKELSLINDEKYVEDYKYYYSQKLDGKLKIEKNLKEKGISSILINKMVFDKDEEIEKASQLIPTLMVKHANKSKLKQKEAVISSLIRKGYTYDIASFCYNKEACKYISNDLDKLNKAIIVLKTRGYEKEIIVKKLLAKGYKYEDILRELKGEKE